MLGRVGIALTPQVDKVTLVGRDQSADGYAAGVLVAGVPDDSGLGSTT